jgi:maleylpyruvate isomerase
MSDARLVELLDSGTRRLVRSVDKIADDQWTRPSLLPGWSRAHVVAHLTLNAEGLAGVLEGVQEGRPVPMYASVAARADDIATLARQSASALRDRFLASTTLIGERVEDLADDLAGNVGGNLAGVVVERTPGGRRFPASDVGVMRVREVEIHHADLALDYTAADWPDEFVVLLMDSRAGAEQNGVAFVAHALDLARTWQFGTRGPTVSGSGSALAWWVTGRGTGEGLTSDDGRVPRMEPW